jgi:hypothetical protein
MNNPSRRLATAVALGTGRAVLAQLTITDAAQPDASPKPASTKRVHKQRQLRGGAK